VFFAALKGMTNAKNIQEEVDQMIESIGLLDKRHTESRNLSGGMKRKLSVGNALIGDSKVRSRAIFITVFDVYFLYNHMIIQDLFDPRKLSNKRPGKQTKI